MYYNVMRQTPFKSLTSVHEEQDGRRKSTEKASGQTALAWPRHNQTDFINNNRALLEPISSYKKRRRRPTCLTDAIMLSIDLSA